MIKVSEIVLPARIETRTDAYRCLHNEHQRENYVIVHGNVECKYDSRFDVYRVPALKEQIARYTAAKAADCAVWGCE